jgi:hypothetical protein
MQMTTAKEIERTSGGMKDALFREWENMIAGTITPQDAREQCRLSNAICAVARIELDHKRFVSNQRNKNAGAVASIPMIEGAGDAAGTNKGS